MLTPAERVLLIRKIADSLQDETWSVLWMTFAQFGVPKPSGTSKHVAILEALEKADSEALVGLGRHVGFELKPSSAPALPAFWDAGYLRLFLTHLSAHKDVAAELQSALRERGISAFVAHSDIQPTKEWQDEILRALQSCDALAALLHSNFRASEWTDQEIGFAMGRGVPIFSIMFGHAPHGFIGRYQALSGGTRPIGEVADDLVRLFLNNPATAGRMAEGLVTLFEQSNTWDEAKSRVKRLREIQTWTQPLLERITAATQKNDQIRNAFGVVSDVQMIRSTRSAG